jgi:hypothetical protein
MTQQRLAALYPSRRAYEKAYAKAVDADIRAGFVLKADRATLIGYSHPELVSP